MFFTHIKRSKLWRELLSSYFEGLKTLGHISCFFVNKMKTILFNYRCKVRKAFGLNNLSAVNRKKPFRAFCVRCLFVFLY